MRPRDAFGRVQVMSRQVPPPPLLLLLLLLMRCAGSHADRALFSLREAAWRAVGGHKVGYERAQLSWMRADDIGARQDTCGVIVTR